MFSNANSRRQRTSIGFSRHSILGGMVVLLGVVSVSVHIWQEQVSRIDERITAETKLIAATAARISAESKGLVIANAEHAAPLARYDSVGTERDLNLELPNQYTVVKSSGNMRKSPLRTNERTEQPDATDELDWLESALGINTLAAQAKENGRGWVFGWLRFKAGTRKNELSSSLKNVGAEIVGGSGRLLRVRFPSEKARIAAVAQLPGVDGVGAVPIAEKLRAFGGNPDVKLDHDPTPMFITLMSDDLDGQWRRELNALGVVVGRYDAQIRVYTANVPNGVLRTVATADFVQAIEPISVVDAMHDTSVAAMGADALRTWTGPGVFSGIGGASVPIGVMDTGLNIRHVDISSNRTSICGTNFVWDNPVEEDQDLWLDVDGHGTHVTGTIIGNGMDTAALAGMAPSVGHVRFAKVLDSEGGGTMDSVLRGMDWLAIASRCEDSESLSPVIVNMSLSLRGSQFEGREARSRKLDATVWQHRQLYVVAQANSATQAFSNYAAAKNSLAVGATYDGGNHAAFSSHGPTADGRLAPHVVAVGVDVCSAKGDGAIVGYDCINGTSMSSPTVAGVAALVMDAAPEHVRQPALVRARLMASAIRPDAWLENEQVFASDNNEGPTGRQERYGLGKVSARTAVLNQDEPGGWFGGGATAEIANDATYAYEDINVPTDATRLAVVLTWDEPPVDGITGAVLNDLDLWLDTGADCGDGDCGERSSRSRIDNVEWVVIKNPTPGLWRLKIVGERVHTESRAAIAWTVIRGASTPRLSVVAKNRSDRITSANLRKVDVDLSVTLDEYVAAGTALHFECRGDVEDCDDLQIEAADLVREDGTVASAGTAPSPTRNSEISLGQPIQLGELANGEMQRIELVVSYTGSKPIRLYYAASSWNAESMTGSMVIQPAISSEDSAPPTLRSANDALHSATTLTGSEGSMQVDLAAASAEPGEPPASATATENSGTKSGWHQRPLGSLWYRFTAPSNRLTTFWLVDRTGNNSVTLDVYTGDGPANLLRIASNQRRTVETFLGLIIDETIHVSESTVFFAEENQTYFIRVANSERTAGPMVMHWHHGEGPAHDAFAAALELSDSAGELDSHNAGATLEVGESFGELAATTWHQWEAPRDGAWEFSIYPTDLRVVVFNGDYVGELRLVSGHPATNAVIYAESGQIYRIAVATKNAFVQGGPYFLSWMSTAWEPTDNDDFEDRAALTGETSDEEWHIDQFMTVEPGEPLASGVRTQWWSWTAPVSGRYTWRLKDTDYTELTLAVYDGASIDDLQFLSSTAPPVTGRELTFQAARNRTYALSLGWPQGDFGSYYSEEASGAIAWGPTPVNDERLHAIALSNQSGSANADDYYGSTALNENNDHLGNSSLWWTWEAPEDGWYKFAASNRNLAIYADDSDTPFARQWLINGEVTFQARAGSSYTIRVGVPGSQDGGAYQLTWQPADAPAWLKYVGMTTESISGAGGASLLSKPTALALSGGGENLFAVSEDGLEVFGRNDHDGSLTPTQTVDVDVFGSTLMWDPAHDRLLANRCGDWFAFTRDGSTFAEVSINVDDDRGNCNKKILTTSDGKSVYTVDENGEGLHRYDIEESGQLQYVETYSSTRVIDAIVTADARRLFITDGRALYEFERDPDTGSIEQTARETNSGESLGIDFDDSWLFAVDETLGNVTVHELLASLQHRATINSRNQVFVRRDHKPYQFVAGRQTGAVDVFGKGVAASFDGATNRITDALREGEDRFGNFIPSFGVPIDLVASPDGRFVYVSTNTKGILIFERLGAGVIPPDLYERLELIEVAAGTVTFGSTSSEQCISVSETEVDGTLYSVLESKWQRRLRTKMEWEDVPDSTVSGEICPIAPTDPGHYRLVVEIDIDGEIKLHSSNAFVVDDHSDTLDAATQIDVPSVTAGWLGTDDHDVFRFELAEEGELTVYSDSRINIEGELLNDDGELIENNEDGGSGQNFQITRILDAGTYFVRVRGDSESTGEYLLHVEFLIRRPDLTIASATMSTLPEVGGSFILNVEVRNDGLLTAPSTTLRFYRSDDNVISNDDLELGSARIPSLDTGETSERELEVAVETVASFSYGACVDSVDGELDTSNNCSAPAIGPAATFSLIQDNGHPAGITYVNGQLFVVDWIDDKVYGYSTSGTRLEDADFELSSETQWSSGITHADGLIYISVYYSDEPNVIQAYTVTGERQAGADFELEDRAPWWPNGIVYNDGLIFVIDRIVPDTVYAYTTSGERQPESDFKLDSENSSATGITYAKGLFYIVDSTDSKVYAYSATGERSQARDFDLESDNTDPQGITFAANQFFIVDELESAVFVYLADES